MNIPENDKQELVDAECWIFDLDNTLYPASCNLFAQVDIKMTKYIAEFLEVSLKKAGEIRENYYRDYGTTMSGMMALHGMEPGEFLNFVHDIDLSALRPNHYLDTALHNLPGRKIVFTNGTAKHAGRVLKQLSIHHHFEEILDIISAKYIPKPFPEPYDLLVKKYKVTPSKAIMVEDLARNLMPAADLGMTTVWVKSAQQTNNDFKDQNKIHHVVDDLTCWLSKLNKT